MAKGTRNPYVKGPTMEDMAFLASQQKAPKKVVIDFDTSIFDDQKQLPDEDLEDDIGFPRVCTDNRFRYRNAVGGIDVLLDENGRPVKPDDIENEVAVLRALEFQWVY